MIVKYLIITIVIFALMHIFEVDDEKLKDCIGKWGVWLFFIIFFIPLVIRFAWLENWDCESNNIKLQ